MSNNIEIKISAKTEGQGDIKSLGAEIKGLSSDLSGLKSSLSNIQQFKKLRSELKEDKKHIKSLREEHKNFSEEIKNSSKVSTETKKKFFELTKVLEKAENEFIKNSKALKKQRSELKKAGVSTAELRAEEKKLVSAIAETESILKKQSKSFIAYNTLGMKAFRDIRSEINKQRQAYKELASTDIGFKEKVKAYSIMKKNIADLNDQTNGWTKNLRVTRNMILGLTATLYGFTSLAGKFQDITKSNEESSFKLASSIKAANREFKNTGSAESWQASIKNLSEELKIYSEGSIESAVSRTIDMTKRLGISEEQMKVLVKRTADLSAGKVDLEGGIERVTAALRGEAESAEYLGLTLNENYVKAQYKANKANKKAWKDLTDLEKAQIRYQEVLKQTNAVQGRSSEYAETYSGALMRIEKTISDSIKNNENIVKSLNEFATVLNANSDEISKFVSELINGVSKVINLFLSLAESYEGATPLMKEFYKIIGLSSLSLLAFGNQISFVYKGLRNLSAGAKDSSLNVKKLTDAFNANTTSAKLMRGAALLAVSAWSGKKVLEAVQAYKEMRTAQNSAKESAAKLADQTARMQEKFREFADIEIPNNIFSKNIVELKELDSGLRKARAYYVALIIDLEQKSKETDFFGNMTEGAEEAQKKLEDAKLRYEEIAEAQKETSKAIIKNQKEISGVVKKENKDRLQSAKESAEQERKIFLQLFKARKKDEESFTNLRNLEQQKQLAEIEALVAKEKITHEEAALKKAELEKKWAKERLKYAKENLEYADIAYGQHLKQFESDLNKAKELYGKDSKEYQKALKIKEEANKQYLAAFETYKVAELKLMQADTNLVNTRKNVKEVTKEASEAEKENTKAIAESAKTTKKASQATSSGTSIMQMYVKWVDGLTEKYAGLNQTQKEVLKSYKELWKIHDRAFLKLGAFHPFVYAAEEVLLKLRRISQAFTRIGEAAWSLGVRINTTNLSLGESKRLIEGLVENLDIFGSETKEIAASVDEFVSGLDNLEKGSEEAFIPLSDLEKKMGELTSMATELYNTHWFNSDEMKTSAEEIIDAYTDIRDKGMDRINSLKSSWQSLSDNIKNVTNQIIDIEKSTKEKIRDLERSNMTEEEAWDDKRLEYNEKINAAMEAQKAGQFEKAAEFYKEAQRIAADLAKKVKNSAGETISSQAENTKTAISLIKKANIGLHESLKHQKNSLVKQQKAIRREIGKTAESLAGLGEQIEGMNNKRGYIGVRKDDGWWLKFWQGHRLEKYADGGYITGPSHAQGGVRAELEGNEFVHPSRAVNHYGLGFMEMVRQLKFPKLSDLKKATGFSIPKFKEGGWVRPQINIPDLPKFKYGGLVSPNTAMEKGAVHTINLNLNGKVIGPLQGEKTTVETFINELKRAQELA